MAQEHHEWRAAEGAKLRLSLSDPWAQRRAFLLAACWMAQWCRRISPRPQRRGRGAGGAELRQGSAPCPSCRTVDIERVDGLNIHTSTLYNHFYFYHELTVHYSVLHFLRG